MVARAALEELALDRLLIVPAAQSPFKPGETSAPAAARVEMLRLAFGGLPGCELDLQEVEREGVSYSIDTVLAVAKRFPEAQL
ncbi:MAG: nicotinate (nicotinamide) nucleotide adenylyltransferase, partial [Verrucomicrobiales bacterium]|nr:nicotinate (nicotinamide) nucleotide adenylyltransferase [Verrucomicrobiales bacterium]